jgi:hypothetical protein
LSAWLNYVLPASVLVPLPAFLLIQENYNRLQVDEMSTNHNEAAPPTNRNETTPPTNRNEAAPPTNHNEAAPPANGKAPFPDSAIKHVYTNQIQGENISGGHTMDGDEKHTCNTLTNL